MANCKYCGEPFIKAYGNEKYCPTKNCYYQDYLKRRRDERANKPIRTYTCQCGNTYTSHGAGRPSQFCPPCRKTIHNKQKAKSYQYHRHRTPVTDYKCPKCGKFRSKEKWCYCEACLRTIRHLNVPDQASQWHSVGYL